MAQGPREAARNARAFTLVELLVTLGVIAVLMSVLLPAVASARRAAWESASNTRLRDLGVLTGAVMAEQGGRLPYLLQGAGSSASGQALELIPAVAELSGDARMLLCPADPAAREPGAAGRHTSYEYWPGPLMLAHESARSARDPRSSVTRWYEAQHESRWPVFAETGRWRQGGARFAVYFGDWHVAPYNLPSIEDLVPPEAE